VAGLAEGAGEGAAAGTLSSVMMRAHSAMNEKPSPSPRCRSSR
jgi:hypothetical protein